MLESLRELKQEIEQIIIEVDKCSSIKSIYDNLFNSTMTMVCKFRKVHEHFNRTFNADADAYLNMKIEEWRRYLRSSQAYSKVDDFKKSIIKFKTKIDIDFEIEQYALMEATNKLIDLMVITRELNEIYNETITLNTTAGDDTL
jgi:hypothetical protein